MASRSDIAWAAGLFEGEGSFIVSTRKPRAYLCSTDLDVLERFLSIVEIGRIKGPQRRPRCKPIWRYESTASAEVARVASLLYADLGARRRAAADRVLDACLRSACRGLAKGARKRRDHYSVSASDFSRLRSVLASINLIPADAFDRLRSLVEDAAE